MKIKVYIVLGLIIASLLALVEYQRSELNATIKEVDRYASNTRELLDTIHVYQTKDSLNVASIGRIELKLSEYKKYRYSDLELINSLKVDNKRLEQVTTALTESIYDLQGSVRDSVVYRDNYITDTLRCVSIHNTWFDLVGCSNRESVFTGRLENRDSLVYVEHIIPKRFLGFLWKCGVKERRQEILSRNPNTRIISAEFISIKK